MRSVRPDSGLHSGCRLSVAIGNEVIWVAAGDLMVALKVAVRHDMVVVPLEESHL